MCASLTPTSAYWASIRWLSIGRYSAEIRPLGGSSRRCEPRLCRRIWSRRAACLGPSAARGLVAPVARSLLRPAWPVLRHRRSSSPPSRPRARIRDHGRPATIAPAHRRREGAPSASRRRGGRRKKNARSPRGGSAARRNLQEERGDDQDRRDLKHISQEILGVFAGG